MANYSASIDIKVNGGEAIKKVNESLAAVERLIAGIKPVPALFDRRTTADTKKAQDDLSALVKEYAAAGISSAKFATSIAGLNTQIGTFQRITANAKAGSDEFKNSIIASERATLRLVEAEQERLKVLRSIYTGPQSKAGAGGTLASGELNSVFKIAQKTIPTIAGITEQIRILENALENIDIGTPIFKNVENLIAQRQSLLENARLGGQSSKLPKSAVSTPVQVGLTGTHATTLAGMKAQSTYYNKIEDLQYKQLVTGQQISKANLTQTQQTELQNRLAQASQALAEGELHVAIRLTTELKSQRIAYERINNLRKTEASKIQTFGTLGTGFLPVTGKMPGGGTVSGSPARLVEEAKAKQKETEAAVALGQQKLKAIEDEAKRERANTKASTALGQQKLKAIEDEAKRLRKETENAVALGQQQLREKAKNQKIINTLSGKTQTFGALGTGFLPVTGKMPGGGTIPGSIAAFEASTKIKQEDTTNRRRTENLVKSSEILEQGLVKAKKAGLDVDTEAQHVRRVINTLTQQGLNFSKLQLDQVDHILKGLRDELTLKKAIAQNNAVPKAVTSRGTVTSVMTKQEKLTNTAELLEQSLLQAKIKGLDVSQAIARVQQVINTLNSTDLSTDTSQLAVLDRTLKILQHELKLKKAIAQTQQPQGGREAGGVGAGGFFERLSNPSSKLGSAVIGGGFPALMGGGPGTMIGGALGGAVGGFAGSIAASAIGQFIDQAVISVQKLGNAFALVKDDYASIRETGIQFTAELESQVRAAKQLGDYTKANQLQQSSLIVTGDISAFTGSQTSATEGIAASVNRLNAAWNEVTKTVSLLLGLVGAPFIEVISLILKGVNAVLAVVNGVVTGVGGLLARIPGVADAIKRSNEEALKTTAEYQNQIAEQDKLIEQAVRLNKANEKLNKLALKNVGLLGAEKQAADLVLRSKEKEMALEEEILKIGEAASSGTEEQKAKAAQLKAQARIKFNNEAVKDLTALYASFYDQITADNTNIARQKEDQEKNYRDMVRDTARLQADLNLDIARKAQDLKVQNIEKENDLIKKQADLRISVMELESKKRLNALQDVPVGADPEEQKIKIGVTEAVDTLKIELAKIDAESADRQRKLKTNLLKLDLEIERTKYDTALRVARINIDNQNKIAQINTQINRQNQDASKQRYTEGLNLLKKQAEYALVVNLRDMKDMQRQIPRLQGTDLEYAQSTVKDLKLIVTVFKDLRTQIDKLLTKVPQVLPEVKQLPTVTANAAPFTAQYNKAQGILQRSEQIDAQGAQVKTQEAYLNAVIKAKDAARVHFDSIQNLRAENTKNIELERARRAIIVTEINPALAEQTAINTRTYEQAKSNLAVLTQQTAELYKGTSREKEIADFMAAKLKDLEAEYVLLQANTIELQKQKSLNETLAMLQAGKRQIAGVEAGARSGFIGQAQSAYATAITENRSVEEATALAQQAQALELATTKARALESAYQDIGSATASLMTEGVAGLVAGTTTAQQVFADFLKNIGDALMKAAQQMIAQYLAIAVARQLAGLFGGGGGGGGGGAQGFQMPEIAPGVGSLGPQRMFAFADGGNPPVGRPSLVGEKGPELFVPRTSGTIVPADATAAAMARYQRKGSGGSSAGGSSDAEGGAAATPVLSMSFETTRFLGQDYVSTDQLQAAMMATEKRAAAAGAKAGAAQVTSKLQQSPAYRRQVGLR